MDTDKKRTRAPGGGRPPKYGERVVALNSSVSPKQKLKYRRLGGSAWLQRAIDEAPEPSDAPEDQAQDKKTP